MKITVKEINDLVWNDKWKGDIDPTALKERLECLLLAEKELKTLRKQLAVVRKLWREERICY